MDIEYNTSVENFCLNFAQELLVAVISGLILLCIGYVIWNIQNRISLTNKAFDKFVESCYLLVQCSYERQLKKGDVTIKFIDTMAVLRVRKAILKSYIDKSKHKKIDDIFNEVFKYSMETKDNKVVEKWKRDGTLESVRKGIVDYIENSAIENRNKLLKYKIFS